MSETLIKIPGLTRTALLISLLAAPVAMAQAAEPSSALAAILDDLDADQQAFLEDEANLKRFRLTPEKLYLKLEGRDAAGVEAFIDAMMSTLADAAYQPDMDAGQPFLVDGVEEPIARTADAAEIPLNPEAGDYNRRMVLRPPILDELEREPGLLHLNQYLYQNTGIPTFANAPVAVRREDLEAGGVEVAFVGAPQGLSSGWRDSQNAPKILRGMYGLGGYDIYAGIDPALELVIADYGNIAVDYMSTEGTVDHLRSQVTDMLEAGVVPFIVGGDHSVMFPTVAAMSDRYGADALTVVHLDAHYGGERGMAHLYSDHQSVYRLLEQELVEGGNIVQLGLRGAEVDADALEWLRANAIKYHTMAELEKDGWDPVMEEVLGEVAGGPDSVFISFDMSVMDPTVAAGAGRPVSNGLTMREIVPFMRRLCAENDVVGFEMLDVAPYLDLSYRTALTANTIMHTCLTGIAMRKLGMDGPHYLSELGTDHD